MAQSAQPQSEVPRQEPTSRHGITSLLLQKYYPVVQTLENYISARVDICQLAEEGRFFLDAHNDPPTYLSLLTTSFVTSTCAKSTEGSFKPYSPTVSVKEVIVRAQENLLSKSESRNVLTAGYRLVADWRKKSLNQSAIIASYRNTTVAALHAPEWDLLLTRIGVDAIMHLFTETSIFLALPNGCLCQVVGEPIVSSLPLNPLRDAPTGNVVKPQVGSSMKRPRPPSLNGIEMPPYKRRRLYQFDAKASFNKKEIVTKTSPADLNLARARLFYARPCFTPHTNHPIVGLPVKHVLNRIHPSYTKETAPETEGYRDPDPRKQAADVRHLSKYIFPGQYGLPTAFQSSSCKRFNYIYADYTDREAEIQNLGSCRTPKRLKDILPLIDKLLWRHGKCAYKPLRDKACPSKINKGKNPLDSSVILELMSERSIQVPSQPSLRLNNTSFDSDGNSIAPLGLTQAKRHAQTKPRFIEFTCSHAEVFRYVVLTTNAIIPKSFWGSQTNFKLVLKHVMQFISCRRYETLSVHYILQGFSTAACDWLAPPGEKAQAQKRVCVSDSLKRRELLEEFIFWYFDGFLIPLLKTTFYITESSAFRNQILYFRQDDWQSLCAPLVDRLVTGMFEKIPDNEVQEILRQRKLGFSFVRLLPKDTGVRPIVNLRRKRPVARGNTTSEQSINQILQAAFNILTYEKNSRPGLLGASVFGPDEVFAKLRAFKTRLPKTLQGNLPQLYFVKVDVQACFDTIDQTKLLEILRELISEDKYVNQRHAQAHFSANRVKRTYTQKAIPKGHESHFLKYATDLAQTLRNMIFVDQMRSADSKKEEILHLLEEHITENMVKIGNHYYRQKVGIPQGSVLSALLCSFFYGDLERRYTKFTEDLHSILLRLIDDYLFVTTDRAKARSFLEMMIRGHPEYGCFISKEKTLTNFDYDAQILNILDPGARSFPWCGYLINLRDLSVSVDYSRYADWGIKNTLTVGTGRRPGAAFLHKMLQLAQAKSHIIYADADLNSQHVVYLNIYQNFLLSAMKMQEYIRSGGLVLAGSSALVYKAIQQMIERTYSSIRVHANRKSTVIDGKKGRCDIKKLAVLWLGSHAFHRVLSRKPHGYVSLLSSLERELGRLRYRCHKRRFKQLVKEGQAAFDLD